MTTIGLYLVSICSLAFFFVAWRWSPLESWPRLIYALMSPVIFFAIGIAALFAMHEFFPLLFDLPQTGRRTGNPLPLIPAGLAWWCWKRFCERKLKRSHYKF